MHWYDKVDKTDECILNVKVFFTPKISPEYE